MSKKQINEIIFPQRVFSANSEVGKYFTDNNKFTEIDNEIIADPKEIDFLFNLAVSLLNKVKAGSDLDFVKREVDKVMHKIDDSMKSFEHNLEISLEETMSNQFNPDVNNSYLQKTVSYMRDSLKDFRENAERTIKIIIENAEKVSTEKLSEIEEGVEKLSNNLNPKQSDSYLATFLDELEDIQNKIDDLFNEKNSDSFPAQLEQILEKIANEDSSLTIMIDSKLMSLKRDVEHSITELREVIAGEKGKEELLSKTAQMKGQLFEDSLFDTLQNIAKPFGDTVEMTGTKKSETTSKKGDFIYSLSEGIDIVIEAKDTNITLKSMLTYLDSAMQNRNCSFSILVVRDISNVPKQVGAFNLYDGNKLFVTADFLEFAIRWSRLYLTKIESEVIEGVDKQVIVQALDSVKTSFKTITSIKQKLSTMNSSVDTSVSAVGTLLDELKNKIEVELSVIESQLED